MKPQKIVVKPTSSNFWWRIYGFCEKTNSEDFHLFYDNGNPIGKICLNTKSYLKSLLHDLEEDQKDLSKVIKMYLSDDK